MIRAEGNQTYYIVETDEGREIKLTKTGFIPDQQIKSKFSVGDKVIRIEEGITKLSASPHPK